MNKTTQALGTVTTLAALGVLLSLAWPSGGEADFPTEANPSERTPAPAEAPVTAAVAAVLPSNSPPRVAGRIRLSPGEELMAALGSDDAQTRNRALQQRLRRWARQDAVGAAWFALGIVDAPLRGQAIRIVAQTWGEEDAEAARVWAAGFTDESERRECLGAVCLGLAGNDAGKGVKLADELGLHGDGMLENLTAQWAATDEGAALTWAGQRPTGPERDRLMQRIAFATALTDPARAARLVVEQIPPGSEQTEAVISVVSQWAQRDLAGATAWVAEFPPGVIRDRAQAELPSGRFPR